MRRVLSGSFAICLLFLSLFSFGQPVFLKNIPTCGDLSYYGCESQKFFGAGSNLYFFSNDSLWKSNGTTGGTTFVKKIGEDIHYYNEIIENGPYFYFTTSEKFTGYEALWRSDGTAANTVKIASNLTITLLTAYKSEVYLMVDDYITGVELWKVNGNGITILKDINPGSGDGYQYTYTISKNILYFRANSGSSKSELWKTDGTAAGTVKAFNMPMNSFHWLHDVNGTIYFLTNVIIDDPNYYPYEVDVLWKTDGTLAGTKKVYQFGEDEQVGEMITLRNKLAMFTSQYSLIANLWISDGTEAGTKFVKSAGIDGYIVDHIVVNDYLIYYHSDQGYVNHIWRSDGTTAGTQILAHTPSADPRDLTKVNDLLFFGDHDGPSYYGYADNYEDSYQIFQSDLSKNNTKAVRKIFGTGSYPGSNNFTEVNGKLYFTTYNDAYGAPASEQIHKLYMYDPFKPVSNAPYFTLVDADTDKDIQWLKNGDTITKYPNKNITVRYNPVGAVGSVQFKVNDVVRRTDNLAPYALGGDNNGNYSPWPEVKEGSFKLSAIPYSQASAKGTAGTPTTITFYVKEYADPKPPIVDAGPNRTIVLPKDSVILTGTASDPDGRITYTYWNKLSGPGDVYYTYTDNRNQIGVNGLEEGNYVFQFSAYDDDETFVYDTVSVIVQKTPAGLAVLSYTLINADNDTDIKVLSNGEIIDLSTLPTQNLNIKVNLNGAASKVVTKYGTQAAKTETLAPYSFFGDNNRNYNGVKFSPGTFTLQATPYVNNSTQGTALLISITIVSGSSTNKPPLVGVGPEIAVILPTTTATISGSAYDPDGSIAKVEWTKVSGDAAVTMTGVNTTSLQLSGLKEGSYTFRLTAIDNKGATGFGDTKVTVVKGGTSVVSYSLINADTDQEIRILNNNDIINVSQLPTKNLNIRINTNPASVGSVKFIYDGASRIENVAPYSIFGDNNGNFNSGVLSNGTYSLSATAFANSNGGGAQTNTLTINFTVTNSSAKMASDFTSSTTVKAYPNPSTTQFAIDVNEPGEEWIIVEILDSRGNLVQTLFEGNASVSGLNLVWDGSKQEAGMYICRIKSNQKIMNEKLYVVR